MNKFNPNLHMSFLCKLAISAGYNAMKHYHQHVEIKQKSDNSPVTLADREGETIIIKGLEEICPQVQIIGEESVANHALPEEIEKQFFLLDPLDGTKEFINQRPDFTVNIGFIEQGVPTAGIVYAPALSELYFTYNQKAFYLKINPDSKSIDLGHATQIKTRALKVGMPLTIVASRSHLAPETQEFLERCNVKQLISAGSSLKFCQLASAKADLYPRHGRTMEWDTAAAHAVLKAAGGTVVDLQGKELTYGKLEQGLANPHFIATSSADIDRNLIL